MRVLVTGASTGIGLATAHALLDDGHDVVAHARLTSRLPRELVERGAATVVADLGDLGAVRALADELADDPCGAVIHNAGVMRGADLMTVNVLAPYVLATRLPAPQRQVFVSSGMHRGGAADVGAVRTGRGSYSDSKLLLTALSAALARTTDVLTSAVDPGWVPTRMGGSGAPDPLDLAHVTQVWLATSDAPAARETGGYWHHQRRTDPDPRVHDEELQDRLLEALALATR